MFSKLTKDSFSMKLYRAFAASAIFISVIITAIFVYYQNRAAETDLVERGRMLTHLLSKTARAGIFAENRELLKDSLQGIGDQKHVTAVWIYSAGGKELFVWGEAVLAEISGKKDDGPRRSPDGELIEVIRNQNAFLLQAPVFIESYKDVGELMLSGGEALREPGLIGVVKVQMDTTHLQTEIAYAILKDGIAVVMILLAGFILIYFSVEKVLRPLEKLIGSVKSFGRGKPFEKVLIESNDEIGRLADAFNQMADDLKRREEEAAVYEEKLMHSKKMEAIGTLTRGISHDFKNILTTIQGGLYIIDKKIRGDSEIMAVSGKMHAAIDKSRELLQGLIAYSKTQRLSLTEMDLCELLRKNKPLIRGFLGESVDLFIHFPEAPLMVLVDAVQIERVFLNLGMNARDAMKDAGTLTITAGEAEIIRLADYRLKDRGGNQVLQEGERPLRFAKVTFTDTGAGMDTETREKIFEPFFTTKESKMGTGLGLSIVYGIIEQHKGHVEVKSEAGKGTQFRIYLPLIEDH